MLNPSPATWRLVLHVLAATIWVGGQFALAAQVASLRAVSDAAVKAGARAFARLAWPAYAVLVLTGFWNLVEIHYADAPPAYQDTVIVKLVFVVASGFGAALHQVGRSKAALAIGGALGGLGAAGALFLGVLLRTGTT